MAQTLDLTIFTNTRRTRVDVDRKHDDGTYGQRSTTAPTLPQVLNQMHPDDRAHLIQFAHAVLTAAAAAQAPTAGLWKTPPSVSPADWPTAADRPQHQPSALESSPDAAADWDIDARIAEAAGRQ